MSNVPTISVIMPAFNAEGHVAQAIDSVLKQSFTDLELIVIDDGSADRTAAIVESFSDSRLRLTRLSRNLGLVNALNTGLDLCRGRYIARMDADDVMLPDRLAKQLAYLQANPEVDVVACFVDLMNADGEITGTWETDRATVTAEEIRAMMPRTNCIAHPTVMIRRESLGDLRYEGGSEDWDLWLKLLARGRRIGKIPEALVLYRVHPNSIMAGQKRQLSLERRLLRARSGFLWRDLARGRFNGFHLAVIKAQVRTTARLVIDQVLRPLMRDAYRLVTYAPWKLLGERKALLAALHEWEGRHLFLFPYVHTGGAEQVHADILGTIADQQPLCLITGFSKDQSFRDRFSARSHALEIPRLVNHPWTRRAALSRIAGSINARSQPHLFASNCVQFFELLPALSPAVRTAYLQHAFLYQPKGNRQHKQWLRLFDRVHDYVFIADQAREQYRLFLRANNFPRDETRKLQVITNRVHGFHEPEQVTGPLRVLFVGRDSPEKRPDLFLRIADALNQVAPDAFRFTAVGIGERPDTASVSFVGMVSDASRMAQLYDAHHVLVLTSDREGFPLVVQEAMAHGLAIAATPVGDIPRRLNAEYAVITTTVDPEVVTRELVDALKELQADPDRLMTMRKACYTKARNEYDGTAFTAAYRSLLDADS